MYDAPNLPVFVIESTRRSFAFSKSFSLGRQSLYFTLRQDLIIRGIVSEGQSISIFTLNICGFILASLKSLTFSFHYSFSVFFQFRFFPISIRGGSVQGLCGVQASIWGLFGVVWDPFGIRSGSDRDPFGVRKFFVGDPAQTQKTTASGG